MCLLLRNKEVSESFMLSCPFPLLLEAEIDNGFPSVFISVFIPITMTLNLNVCSVIACEMFTFVT